MEAVREHSALERVATPEEFLDAVDFDALNDIFSTILKKSGEDSPETRHLSRNSISVDMSSLESPSGAVEPALAHRETRTITLYWKEVEKAHGGDPAIPIGVMALQILIHEMTHLYSREVSWPDSPVAQRGQEHVGFGLADYIRPKRRRKNDKRLSRAAESLNEAVTEEVALEAFSEYLRRKGQGALLKNENIQSLAGRGYTGDRIIFNTVVDALAKKLEVHRDMVWRGFVQEYMNGNTQAIELVRDVVEELNEHADLAMLLYESTHEDPREVQPHIENPAAVGLAIDRVVNRFSPDFLHDTLGLR